MLISVEAKRVLDKEIADTALLECGRDLVSQTLQVASTRMRPRYSIISTAGVEWYFVGFTGSMNTRAKSGFAASLCQIRLLLLPPGTGRSSPGGSCLCSTRACTIKSFRLEWKMIVLISQLGILVECPSATMKRQKREETALEISHTCIFPKGSCCIVSYRSGNQQMRMGDALY